MGTIPAWRCKREARSGSQSYPGKIGGQGPSLMGGMPPPPLPRDVITRKREAACNGCLWSHRYNPLLTMNKTGDPRRQGTVAGKRDVGMDPYWRDIGWGRAEMRRRHVNGCEMFVVPPCGGGRGLTYVYTFAASYRFSRRTGEKTDVCLYVGGSSVAGEREHMCV